RQNQPNAELLALTDDFQIAFFAGLLIPHGSFDIEGVADAAVADSQDFIAMDHVLRGAGIAGHHDPLPVAGLAQDFLLAEETMIDARDLHGAEVRAERPLDSLG